MRCLLLCLLLSLYARPAAAQVAYPFPTATIADVLQYTTPVTGATVAMDAGSSLLIINNAALLVSLTVTLPPSPMDGQRVIIASGAGVTLLTVNGGTIKGIITGLSVNGYARFAYSAAAGAWFRTG
ncbi:hypothetical protein [Novosphingobium sp. BL-52-GroH]|uniref:hypothetical protein n=1 Tax=Novosphingobium sp. BL-52-GroH TaxID=3349877 RepID=UPI00384EA2F1